MKTIGLGNVNEPLTLKVAPRGKWDDLVVIIDDLSHDRQTLTYHWNGRTMMRHREITTRRGMDRP